tara:strand:+ start:10046 stop:10681 length:636 start_codon:yes stop_codon:yes gene_type:complete
VTGWRRIPLTLASAALALLATLAQGAPEEECSCLWQGSFAEVEAQTDLVAAVTVLGGKGNSLDVTVDRILRGREFNEKVRLWLKARDYCRPDAEEFPVGTRWVMALYRIAEEVPGGFDPDTPNISYGRLGDYRLSSCGGYWLELHEDRVTGNLVNAPRWERAPKMTPVLLDLLAAYIDGVVDSEALLEASREDPALRELMLDTREFLRQVR